MTHPLENPHKVHSVEWFAWKEQNLNYVPYHVGLTPSGDRCTKMPRARLVSPGVYRCPSCGKEFPTATAQLAAQVA